MNPKIKRFKEIIKKIVKEVIDEHKLKEVTGSGAIGGGSGPIRTPFAFSAKGSKRMEKIAKKASPGSTTSKKPTGTDTFNIEKWGK
jgi:hypothetical protein